MQIEGFLPIADARATHLILGSMPGSASLTAREYYAHPYNAFWRIMTALLAVASNASYTARICAVQDAKIAVWDVLQSCERPGSLDSSIRRDSEIANDFATFFAQHPQITQVFFNGSAAEAGFKRHCRALLGNPRFSFQRLPSTSPAHASLHFEQKLAAWRAVTTSLSSAAT